MAGIKTGRTVIFKSVIMYGLEAFVINHWMTLPRGTGEDHLRKFSVDMYMFYNPDKDRRHVRVIEVSWTEADPVTVPDDIDVPTIDLGAFTRPGDQEE